MEIKGLASDVDDADRVFFYKELSGRRGISESAGDEIWGYDYHQIYTLPSVDGKVTIENLPLPAGRYAIYETEKDGGNYNYYIVQAGIVDVGLEDITAVLTVDDTDSVIKSYSYKIGTTQVLGNFQSPYTITMPADTESVTFYTEALLSGKIPTTAASFTSYSSDWNVVDFDYDVTIEDDDFDTFFATLTTANATILAAALDSTTATTITLSGNVTLTENLTLSAGKTLDLGGNQIGGSSGPLALVLAVQKGATLKNGTTAIVGGTDPIFTLNGATSQLGVQCSDDTLPVVYQYYVAGEVTINDDTNITQGNTIVVLGTNTAGSAAVGTLIGVDEIGATQDVTVIAHGGATIKSTDGSIMFGMSGTFTGDASSEFVMAFNDNGLGNSRITLRGISGATATFTLTENTKICWRNH